ncbi:MAG: YbhB/YbcL family Raf kinase inhibitor-like protein [Propionibacteriaceae bacterium]|jgi:Raf kinase inhibitor-like YbhB/YbcL family protein|nr:YbhB/YbcL family Raf kinase inhibitor-like protein [Propionibacteriaceae bacterium]
MTFDPNRPQAPHPYEGLPAVPSFLLTSPQITEGERLPYELSDDGGAHSPELNWRDAPAETKSFLITCFDPDAPRPGGFWHWLLVDVPTCCTGLPYDAGRHLNGDVASAYSTINSRGDYKYVGAAPPAGDQLHRYFFAVHALDVTHLQLPLGTKTSPVDVAFTALPHTIARAVLMGGYQR